MKTAVQWLEEKLTIEKAWLNQDRKRELFNQAKEMEKQQIIDAYETSHISMMTSEQYYNETYGKDKSET
jgi:hypothetical protein